MQENAYDIVVWKMAAFPCWTQRIKHVSAQRIVYPSGNGPLTRYLYHCWIRMCWECRERFPYHRLQRKVLVSEPSMHHSTCVTHVKITDPQWRGKPFLAFPAHVQPAILSIWQEAHPILHMCKTLSYVCMAEAVFLDNEHLMSTTMF